MGKLFTALKRVPKRTGALVAVAAAIIIPATLFAWGPDRPTFTEQDPAPYVTFNSITNNSFYGDERNFTTIKDAANTSDGGWTDTITAVPGKEYVVRMYVHNNAADHLNLVATNVRASASVPTTVGKSVPISGFVTADNSNPGKIWDDVKVTSDKDFNLAYVPGSASFNNNGIGNSPQGIKLPDSIVTNTGALLGYDKLDGRIPGCYKYSGYVYFKVKPQFAANPNFTTSKYVSKHGENKWVDDYKAQPGETVDYLINYKNTGDSVQENVQIKDTLPKDMVYVTGSSILGNGLHPTGIKTNDGVTTTGLNIGVYAPGSNAWIIFSAKVPELKDLVCGDNKLRNVARVTSVGYYKEDTADVTVPKECQPEVKYTCDALTVAKINRTNFKFTTATTQQNATFKKVTYVIRNGQGTEVERKESTNKTLDYTRTEVGKYTVEAIVTFTVNGQDKTASSENCRKPFEVEKIPETPVYTCDALTFTKISRTNYSFTGKATAEGGASVVSYTFDFGDGQTATVASPNDMKHKYAKDGTYTAKLSVTVKVNDSEKTVTSDKCIVKVTVFPEECKPGIPVGDDRCKTPECKPGIPMNDDRCKETPCVPDGKNACSVPPELPKTGSDENVLALIGAGSLIASVGYYVASRRSLLG